ncbi:hypothetical protein ACF8R6_01480 [Pseudomonas sp. CJQ_7]|uniref:hypothetical protein n=1 Tax=Pseudomonas sp. CJQ_7 TaxID=3367166 RepID=UPI003709C72D
MPTENRSSNTEMVSVPFHREDRYIVVKRSDLAKVPVAYRSALVDPLFHLQAHLPQRECLVIESDWPEYEPTWAAIKARVTGQAAPQSQAEPIAWMVGTAFWWTKEEAERDAVATGKPIIPFGPMIDTREVDRLRAALSFYADREHYHFESGNWDTVSGEPLNILWCGEEPDFIEDGSVARAALERKL